ncbi:MAG TPA: SMI1/KNR4 family protein [Armatimonadota bacterium]|nr:SMI1/KNR4 family protein [Armatimonadota bacterium]
MSETLGYVQMTGPDRHLDTTGYFDDPINRLPVRCDVCTFPDLDYVPQPYLLGRGINRPVDLALANLGNFLVRDRPRQVIETVSPGQCRFIPTVDRQTGQPAPWYLAVPVHRVSCGGVLPGVPRCPQCGEPKTAHVNDFEFQMPPGLACDIAGSEGWLGHDCTFDVALDPALRQHSGQPLVSAPTGWSRRRIYRYLFFSLRMELLFKKLKLKGLTRCAGDLGAPNAEDRRWVVAQLERLSDPALTSASGPETEAVQSWFSQYLDRHRSRESARVDWDWHAVEAALGTPLPPSYKTFIETVGATTFTDVEQEEGFEAQILAPPDVDARSFRRGVIRLGDEESRQVDGLLFAATGHGDAFCFDLTANTPDYPVYLYNHEESAFEGYASSFVECVRRFVGAGP